MAKIAVILLADTDRPEGMGRMANALTTAEEAKDAGDEIRVILDGAGTKWGAELADESHMGRTELRGSGQTRSPLPRIRSTPLRADTRTSSRSSATVSEIRAPA